MYIYLYANKVVNVGGKLGGKFSCKEVRTRWRQTCENTDDKSKCLYTFCHCTPMEWRDLVKHIIYTHIYTYTYLYTLYTYVYYYYKCMRKSVVYTQTNYIHTKQQQPHNLTVALRIYLEL